MKILGDWAEKLHGGKYVFIIGSTVFFFDSVLSHFYSTSLFQLGWESVSQVTIGHAALWVVVYGIAVCWVLPAMRTLILTILGISQTFESDFRVLDGLGFWRSLIDRGLRLLGALTLSFKKRLEEGRNTELELCFSFLLLGYLNYFMVEQGVAQQMKYLHDHLPVWVQWLLIFPLLILFNLAAVLPLDSRQE